MESRSTKSINPLRNIDWFTVILYLIMVVAGVVSIYASTYDYDNSSMFSFQEFSGKQFLWIGLSMILGISILLIDRQMFEAYAYPIYFLMLIVLIVTIFIAPNVKGSHSWIVLGPVSVQPAEFAKCATALALAKLFSTYNFSLNKSLKNYGLAAAIILTPVLLILLQNETGSALVYFSLAFVLYREGMSGLVLLSALCAIVIFVVALKFQQDLIIGIPTGEFAVFVLVMIVAVAMLLIYVRSLELSRNIALWYIGAGIVEYVLSLFGWEVNGYIFFLTVIGLSVAYMAYGLLHEDIKKLVITMLFVVLSIGFLFAVNFAFSHLKDHQRKRIEVTLGIVQDIRDAGYNVNQSKIAIGSGGLWGKGFLNGTQTKLSYVPEQHTDFIYCTIGEEAGFVGASAVIVLFVMLILRIIHLAERQRTAFGRVYAYSIASYFILHLSINVGMVLGLCPVIGIPLPFFSYGGSSLWGFTILLFILLRIDASRRESGNY